MTDEKGAALVLAMIVATVALGLGISGARLAGIEQRIAHNDLLSKKALAAAEAGVHHAVVALRANPDFGPALASGTGGPLTDVGGLRYIDGTGYRFRSLGDGPEDGYYVRLEDNWDEQTGSNDPTTDLDDRIHIVSEGRIGNAVRRVVSMVEITTGGGSPRCAIVTRGYAKINGNPEIRGTRGCAHSNDAFEVTGNPEFDTPFTASKEVEITGNPTIAGRRIADPRRYEREHSNRPEEFIPQVRPLNFNGEGINLANEIERLGANGFLLGDDCKVYPGNTSGSTWRCEDSSQSCAPTAAPIADAKKNKWHGWDCSEDSSSTPGAKWTLGGNSTIDGGFFVEGWVNVSGNPGQSGAPWSLTLVAMNTIDISGTPTMVPFATTALLKNLLLVSGNDVGIGGNPGQPGREAAILAHQQVKLNGNPRINGFIVAEDGKSRYALDPAPSNLSKENKSDRNEVSGNATITYDGTAATPLFPGSTTVTILSWSEVRAS